MGGNLYIGTSTDSYVTSTQAVISINNGGQIGINLDPVTTNLFTIGGNFNTTEANARGLQVKPTFNGPGLTPGGLGSAPVFAMTTDTTIVYGFTGTPKAAIPTGVTLTTQVAGFFRNDSAVAGLGAVTNMEGLRIGAPNSTLDGSKPTTIYGIRIQNQGSAGITNSYGLYVNSPSLATNNYAAIFEGGNIGLGSTTPVSKLTLEGTTGQIISFSVDDTTLSVDQELGSLDFWGNDTQSQGIMARIVATAQGTTNQFGNLRFYTGSTAATLTERMRLDWSGRFGVGTSTPNWVLQVSSSTKTLMVLSDFSASAPTNGKHWFISSMGGNFYVGTSSDAFATTTYFTIKNGGNIGIGTTTPSSQLQIFNVATSTVSLDSNAVAKGGCLEIKDMDGGGYTYCTALDGVLSCSIISCK